MTLRNYIIGFGASIVLTLTAFWLVAEHIKTDHLFPSHSILLPALILLALFQFLVQLICFLHIGKGKDRRSNIITFAFALFIVVIIVGGTLWIMANLSYNHGIPYIRNEITPQTEND